MLSSASAVKIHFEEFGLLSEFNGKSQTEKLLTEKLSLQNAKGESWIFWRIKEVLKPLNLQNKLTETSKLENASYRTFLKQLQQQ